MPNGLLHDDSLRPHPDGLALRLTIPWYRSLWLSSVTTLDLSVGDVVWREKLVRDVRLDLRLAEGGLVVTVLLAALPAEA